MVKKLILGLLALFLVVLVGGALLVRRWLDPENIRLTLERQASLALELPVSIGEAELEFWPRAGVTLHELAIGSPASMTLTRTTLSTEMRALLSRRIEDAELVVEDSTLDLPFLLATLERLSKSSASPAPPSAGPTPDSGSSAGIALVNVRTIALQNVRVQAGSRSAVVSMQAGLDGDRLQVDTASVTSEVTTLEATGAIESLEDRRGRLAVTAESLDLDGLLVFAQEFARQALPPQGAAAAGEPAGNADPGPLDLTLEISAASGRASGVSFEALKATAHVTPGAVALQPFSLGVFGGRLDGAVRADLSQLEPALAVEGTLQGVDMTSVTEFTGQPGAISGTLNGRVAVRSSGTDPSVALAGARGNGSVIIANGAIRGLQLVRPIVLAFGKPDAAQPVSGGERFERLDATFTLADGIVTLGAVMFQSRDVELDGAGRLALLDGGRLDLKANARLSKELTAQAGRDLVRYTAEDGRVTVPATVTGPIANPQVGVDVGSVAKRAVTNELKRQTDSLIRDLFNRKKKP